MLAIFELVIDCWAVTLEATSLILPWALNKPNFRYWVSAEPGKSKVVEHNTGYITLFLCQSLFLCQLETVEPFSSWSIWLTVTVMGLLAYVLTLSKTVILYFHPCTFVWCAIILHS